MNQHLPGLLSAVALCAAIAAPAAAAPPDMDEMPLTLSGCVVAGEEKDSYLLTNVRIEGETLAPSNAFYRFDTTKDLKKHVGRRVEVKGKADLEDMDRGKLEVKVDEDGKAQTKITSERRTVEVDRNVWFGSTGAMKVKADVPTYKLEVDKVRRVAGNCN